MSPIRTTLVGPEELAAWIGAGIAPVILDASFDLGDPGSGERRFAESHVPGSRYVHLDRDLAGAKSGRNGRHPLPERSDFARTVGRLGISPGTQVVALDAQGGIYAARLWWMLRWLGHEAVAVLDGGLQAWQKAGGALTSEPTPAAAPAPPYPERPPLVPAVDAAAVAGRPAEAALVDARAAERFRGETEPLDRIAGHIPGALNRFYKANLDATGRFKPADELRREFETLLGARGPVDVIHSCGSGVTACHNLLAMEHAGLAGSALYPGSWSEWSSDPERPVATG
ncbi:MAG TPA: sulfurtransferase [Caldimonas sp.]|jgi:thiosulfate/3-mercaptopyruvate sulfurtransferase|nr:sulfurtransferase [Caldimonas sp.]HEX2539780.1 sulfurtransferase [Caldimonas sp.]